MADRRRKSDRKSKRISVRYGIEKPDILGYSKDVSDTGIKMECRKIFKPGTLLFMTVGDEPAVVRGRVMWARSGIASELGSMGINFENAPAPVATVVPGP
jgi:hypothetical protein